MTDPTPPPVEVPGFQLDERIGEGLSGEVWRARRQPDGQVVALKLLTLAGPDGARLRERFAREADILRRHPHPCVVPLLGAGLDHDPPYLCFRFLEGGDLSAHARKGRLLPAAEVYAAVRRVATAVDFLHQQGVMHRDLKPGNILRDRAGRAYLADLGLGKLDDAQDLTGSGQMLGTFDYMPPEVQLGRPAVPRGDLYSLAAVLVRLLCGKVPRRTPQGVELPPAFEQVEVPRRLKGQIKRCLRHEPEDRPDTAEALIEALDQALDD